MTSIVYQSHVLGGCHFTWFVFGHAISPVTSRCWLEVAFSIFCLPALALVRALGVHMLPLRADRTLPPVLAAHVLGLGWRRVGAYTVRAKMLHLRPSIRRFVHVLWLHVRNDISFQHSKEGSIEHTESYEGQTE